MEQNSDRMYWTIGIVILAAFILLGTLTMTNADVLPAIKDKVTDVFNGKDDKSPEADKEALEDETNYNISVSGVTTYDNGVNLYNKDNNDKIIIDKLDKKDGLYQGAAEIDLSRYSKKADDKSTLWSGIQVNELSANLNLTKEQKAAIDKDFLAATNDGTNVELTDKHGNKLVSFDNDNPSQQTQARIRMKDGSRRIITVQFDTKNKIYTPANPSKKTSYYNAGMNVGIVDPDGKVIVNVGFSSQVYIPSNWHNHTDSPLSFYSATYPELVDVDFSNYHVIIKEATLTLNNPDDFYTLDGPKKGYKYNPDGIYPLGGLSELRFENSTTTEIYVAQNKFIDFSKRISINTY